MPITLRTPFWISLFLTLLYACGPGPRAEAEDVVQEFEAFVNATEQSVQTGSVETWEAIDSTYATYEQRLTAHYQQMDQRLQDRVRALEERYRTTAQQFKTQTRATEQRLDQEVEALTLLVDSVEQVVSEATTDQWQALSTTYRTRRDALRQDLDQATEAVVESVETLDDRFEAAQEAWETAGTQE